MSTSNFHDQVITKIGKHEGLEINRFSALHGGSINDVFLLYTSAGKKVLKLNESSAFPGMFMAEKEGLMTLRKTQTIDIPKVLACGEIETQAYLLLEYKESAPQQPDFWEVFAEQLAALHKNSSSSFGFSSSNYIGSLPQYNSSSETAGDFYISQRIEPQIRLAIDNNFSFGNLEQVYQKISEAIPKEPPALIHGDLWNGNYLVNEKGLPCLIDPAVCYAPREMDLSMMKLFGGFPERFFTSYSAQFPLESGFEERVPLWQLYYLLVHLNIFGSSYLAPVKNILRNYS